MSYPRGSAVIPSKRAKFETLDPLQLSSPFRRLDEAALSLERDRHKKNAASEGAFSSHDTVSSRNGALLETKNGLAESCEVESLPSDTLAAVWLLRGQFPRGLPKVTPFALRSQLYAVVDDKTRVDRELDVLRRANRIRMFRIPTSVEDAAVQLTDDYVAAVLRYADDAPPSRHAHLPALRWFCDYVLPNCTSDIIAHEELLKLMKEGIEREVKRFVENC